MERSERQIDLLVASRAPTRGRTFGRSLAQWLAAAVAIWSVYLAVVGPRIDLAEQAGNPVFLLSLVLLAFAFVLASWWCLEEGIPGLVDRGDDETPLRRLLRGLLLGTAHVVSLALYARVYAPTTSTLPLSEALLCCLRITAGAVPPCVVLSLLAVKLFPLNVRTVSALSVTSSVMLVSLVSQVNCPHSDTAHVLVGHGLLLWGVNAATFYFAHRFLARTQKRRLSRALADS